MRFLALIFGISLFLTHTQPAAAADTQALLASGGTGGWVNTERPLTADDFKGRLVLLDFWTYGCINCMQVIPDLDYLEKTYPQLLIVGVHSAKYTGEGLSDRIKKAAERFGIHHPVMNDNDYKVWDAFGVKAWPTLVLLDGQGKELSRYAGEGHRAQLEADIKDAIAKGEGTAGQLSGVVTKQADTGLLKYPSHLVAVGTHELLVGDTAHHQIVAIDSVTGKEIANSRIGSGVAGFKDGDTKTAQFNMPRGLVRVGDVTYVADTGNHAIRKVDAQGNVTTVAGNGTRGGDRNPDGQGTDVALASPWDLDVIEGGKALAIANAGTHQLFRYDLSTGNVTLLAGNGRENIKDDKARDAELAQSSALSADGNTLYFVDAESSSLRMLKDGTVKTLIGTGLFDFGRLDGTYPKASLQHAQGVFASNGKIYVADTYNNALRVYDVASATLSTVKLTGESLSEPGDVTVQDNTAFITDTGHHRIVKVDLASGKAEALTSTP